MKTIDKIVNLSQAKKALKKHATAIVKMLELRGVKMIKKNDSDSHWESLKGKESCAKVCVDMYENITLGYFDFFILMVYPHLNNPKMTTLELFVRIKTEKKIYKKYPLTNLHISLTTTRSKKPTLEQAEKVAEQLYLALKCYNKINCVTSKIKMAQKRINELCEKEADEIVKSLFK